LRLDRYEALTDLSNECSTLKFDLSSLQPDIEDDEETSSYPSGKFEMPNNDKDIF
jgi:hypothetical protein